MSEAKYSQLMFAPDLEESMIEELTSAIQNGRKVFFTTFDDTEELLKNDLLAKAITKGLLSLSTVRYSDKLENKRFVFHDGEVDDLKFLNYLDENSLFNKEQYILEHNKGSEHCLVKAGAGTGKTTTMISRIMFLKHMNPNLHLKKVVMITFTNEAAAHLREKFMGQLKNYYELTKNKKYLEWMEEAGGMFIGTIHSFAKKFLEEEGRDLGFSKFMQIRSYQHVRKRLIETYIDEFSNKYPEIYQNFVKVPHYLLVRTFLEIMQRIYNKSISIETIPYLDFGVDDRNFHEFARFVITKVMLELDKRKTEDESLELFDLISKLSTITNYSKNHMKLSIQYLFVDEFQDTDEAQVAFISWLVNQYGCQLFVVGDIKQSIYRFRGADYTAFSQLKEQLFNKEHLIQEFSLRKNYRSTPLLINHFNSLFKKWDQLVDKFEYNESDRLIPVKDNISDEGLVSLNFDETVLKYLLKRLYNKDTAVLVRSNQQVLEMVKRIEKCGYFCEANISGAFYRSLPVREFYLLIRRFTHADVPKDRYLFHQSSYGENKLTISQILKAYTPEKNFILDLLQPFDTYDLDYIWNSKPILSVFQDIIDTVQPEEVFRIRFFQQLRSHFPDVNEEMHKKEAIAKMKEYKLNLDRLMYILKKEFGDFQASIYDLEKFLSIKMATDTTETEIRLQNNVDHRIKVMTVHKSKGLEFDYVLMPLTKSAFVKNEKIDVLLTRNDSNLDIGYHINWIDDTFENTHYKKYIGSERTEMIAEESRLLYVALTRAKKAVYVDNSTSINTKNIQCWSDLIERSETLIV